MNDCKEGDIWLSFCCEKGDIMLGFFFIHIGILFLSPERGRTRSCRSPGDSQVAREQYGGTGRTCIQEPEEWESASTLIANEPRQITCQSLTCFLSWKIYNQMVSKIPSWSNILVYAMIIPNLYILIHSYFHCPKQHNREVKLLCSLLYPLQASNL